MLKFFRKIRQQLLNSRQMKKYSLYALGEIVLVVLGILIALQINTWNEERKNRVIEQEVLTQLQDEYQNNLKQLQQKIQMRDSMMNAAKTIHLNKQELAKDVVAFENQLFKTLLRPTFDPALGVTNELINSGKLYLIQNQELKVLLSSWTSYVNELEEEEVLALEMVTNDYLPFLRKHYQMGNVYLQGQKQKVVELFRIGNVNQVDDIKFSRVAPTALINHPDFEDHLSWIITMNNNINAQSEGIKKVIERILKLISQESNPINQ